MLISSFSDLINRVNINVKNSKGKQLIKKVEKLFNYLTVFFLYYTGNCELIIICSNQKAFQYNFVKQIMISLSSETFPKAINSISSLTF